MFQTRPDPGWRKEDGQKGGLEQEDVPLITEEDAAHGGKRKVKAPERDQRPARSESGDERERQGNSRPTRADEKKIAGIEPKDGGYLEEPSRRQLFMKVGEVVVGRPDTSASNEAFDLNGQ